MNAKPALKVRDEISTLAAAIDAAPGANQTEKQKITKQDLWQKITNSFTSDPMVKAGEIGVKDLHDKVEDFSVIDSLIHVDKMVVDFFFLLLQAVAPLMGLLGVASMENETGLLKISRNKIRPTVLSVGQLQELFRRHQGGKELIVSRLADLGYDDVFINELLELSVSTLGANDILNLLSRNTFDEDYVKKYGLDKGYQTALNYVQPLLEAAGEDVKHFKYFYRAHWSEIPLNLLQIMHQRGQLSEQELTDQLKARNYPDYFIPKIKQALFTYQSKLDIRKMYAEGLIHTKKELIIELEKIGFSAEGAEMQAELYETMKNKERVIPPQLKTKGEGNILHAYSVQLINKKECKELLMALGYNEDDADFVISDADYDNQWALTKMHLEAYHKAYLHGIYSDSELIAALGHLNLPSGYFDTILDTWKLEIVHAKIKTEKPSRAEILKWFANGLLTEMDARTELKATGLSDRYIQIYIEQTKMDMIKTKGGKSAVAAT